MDQPTSLLKKVVDGRMALGWTGSGHHIRNFYSHLTSLGVEVACFDACTGHLLELDEHESRSQTRIPPVAISVRLRARLGPLVPGPMKWGLIARWNRRVKQAYLRAVGTFSEDAFIPLKRFAPNFIIHRMVHGNSFIYQAWRHTAIPYGLECNAPILFQEDRYGTLIQSEECREREALVLSGAQFITFVSKAISNICHQSPVYRKVPSYVISNCADEGFFAPLNGRQ